MTVREQIHNAVSGGQAEGLRNTVDGLAVGTVIGVLLGYLPHIAAGLTVLWAVVRLYNEVMTAIYRKRDRRAEGK